MSNITYSVKEVAQIFYVNAETIRRWVRQEKIIPTDRNLGRSGSKFTLEDIEDFARNSEQKFYLDCFTNWAKANNILSENNALVNNFEENSKEEPSISSKLTEERFKLIELKKKLAELSAEIATTECKIEYYKLLLMSEE